MQARAVGVVRGGGVVNVKKIRPTLSRFASGACPACDSPVYFATFVETKQLVAVDREADTAGHYVMAVDQCGELWLTDAADGAEAAGYRRWTLHRDHCEGGF